MNNKPNIPDLSCPVPETPVEGYFTENQSYLNTAKKDKFRLIFNVPKGLRRFFELDSRKCNGGNLDKLHYSIWGNVIPDISVPKTEKPYAGQTLKYTSYSRASYPAITVNFTVDNTFDNYYVIWKWLDIMAEINEGGYGGTDNGFIKSYSENFIIQSLDEYNKPVVEWTFVDAFPSAIGSINYTGRSQGEEIETTFSFEFSQLQMKLI